jgi:hypothetical protein
LSIRKLELPGRKKVNGGGEENKVNGVNGGIPSAPPPEMAYSKLTTGTVLLWLSSMASITLKDIPDDLHAQLKNEASANFRSLTQEAMARLERTFEIDAALTTKRDQRWVDEALASGPESPLTEKEMDAIRDRILKNRKRAPRA